MRLTGTMQKLLLWLTDLISAATPTKARGRGTLNGCLIVSHRGEHDNRRVLENTTAAFDRAAQAGVWGLELDVRWTRDLHPVVFHDASTLRLYGTDRRVENMDLRALQREFPQIPSLNDVVLRYGGRLHLMVEIKCMGGEPASQNERLRRTFTGLSPVRDYHVLSLDSTVLDKVRFAPQRALLPIAETNVRHLSDFALRKGCGGITGHYLMMNGAVLKRHRRYNQAVGTGFVNSRNCLYREAGRGVKWLFSNRAAEMQRIVNKAL